MMNATVARIKRQSLRRAAVIVTFPASVVIAAFLAVCVAAYSGIKWMVGAQIILSASAVRAWRRA